MSYPRAAFFFGSGISFASGAPTVGDITASALDGAWRPHTDSRFYPRPATEEKVSAGDALRAQQLLRVIKEHIDPHLKVRERREANYEDLYAATRQIVQDETFEVTNPLIAGTLAAIKAASANLHEGQHYHIDRNSFASLADRASDLVQWAAYFGLARATKPVGMALIGQVAQAVQELDIFSLNHERLIELQLEADGLQLADGFGEAKGDVRIFSGDWRRTETGIRLLKLHGSTNWYLFRFSEWDQFASVKGNVDYAKDENGKLLDALAVMPHFLTGTTVKEQTYGHGLIGELFSEFRHLLSRHRTLICCGYGWGDKGINIRLNQWLRDAQENRIVILHGGNEDELRRCRFWYFRWDDYRKAGKVVVIPKWLSACALTDLEAHFDR